MGLPGLMRGSALSAVYTSIYIYIYIYIYMGGSQIAPRHLRSVVHQARWRLWILCVSSLSTLAPARDFLDLLLGSWPGKRTFRTECSNTNSTCHGFRTECSNTNRVLNHRFSMSWIPD